MRNPTSMYSCLSKGHGTATVLLLRAHWPKISREIGGHSYTNYNWLFFLRQLEVSLHYVNFKSRPMSHAHNRPLTSCRVSKRTGKDELFLSPLAKLFYGFLLFKYVESITDVACLPFSGTNLFSDVFTPLFWCIASSTGCSKWSHVENVVLHALWLLKKLTSRLPLQAIFCFPYSLCGHVVQLTSQNFDQILGKGFKADFIQ